MALKDIAHGGVGYRLMDGNWTASSASAFDNPVPSKLRLIPSYLIVDPACAE